MKKTISLFLSFAFAGSILLSEETPAPAPPGTTPPGQPGEGPDKNGKQLDFLQRSNLIFAKLLESDRATDPFGLLMDPANVQETPVLADQYEEVVETPVLNNSSLKTAILTLPITGIYPQRGVIVIGARSFPIGGEFGMKLQDLTIRLRFEGIQGTEVLFKDMETQEVASVPFNALPNEFEPLTNNSSRGVTTGIIPMNELFIAN